MRGFWIPTVIAAATLVALGSNPVAAEHLHGRGRRCATPGCTAGCSPVAPCAPVAPPQMVARTIMVPEMSLETRTVMVPEYRCEQRQRTVSVPKLIPKQVTVTRPYTVMIPKCVTKTVTCQVRKPVYADVEVRYSVCVPHLETRSGTRKVCKLVATQKTRTITVDEGHWEDAPEPACDSGDTCTSPIDCCRPRCRLFRRCSTGCGPATCGADGCGSRVWVSNLVEKQIPYTCQERVWEDVPYTCTVTVMKPETRTRMVRRCSFVFEPHTKQVTQTICVPETRTKTCIVTQYDCVPCERTIAYSVCVPHYVARQIQVPVCKMVPKTIQVPAPCAPCAADAG